MYISYVQIVILYESPLTSSPGKVFLATAKIFKENVRKIRNQGYHEKPLYMYFNKQAIHCQVVNIQFIQ